MYLSSAAPILPGDRERAARKLACAAARRNDAAVQSVDGRLELWQTITSPADLAQMFGAQLGANALMMQSETAVARQDALLGTGTDISLNPSAVVQQAATPTVQQVMASAPKSYSLNGQPSQVNGCEWVVPPPVPLGPSPSPTMPLRAPVVYQTAIGPASMPPGTTQSRTLEGLTGYAPPWSDALVTDSQSQMDNPDAGVGGWIASHPWLALAIAVGGAVVLSRRQK